MIAKCPPRNVAFSSVNPWLPVAIALASSTRLWNGSLKTKNNIISVRALTMDTKSTMCPGCFGEGLVLKKKGYKATSKSRSLETQLSILSNRLRPHHTIRPCDLCYGTGVQVNNNIPSDQSPPSEAISNGDAASIHVAIVGGGIGGCALALALCQRNISCTLYEKDISSNVRSQGYGLTIQQGFKVLQSLGLIHPLERQSSIGIKGAGHFVYQSDGTIQSRWGSHSSSSSALHRCSTVRSTERNPKRFNVIIPRKDLRQLILDQIPPHVIKWGHELVGYSKKDEKIEASFLMSSQADKDIASITATADILVGADGIWSRVRKCMYGQNDPSPLRYLKCIVILGIAPTPTSQPDHPLKLDDPNNPIIFETMDGETRIYGMPHRFGETMWQLSFPMSCEDSAKKLSSLGAEAMKHEAIRRCSSWHEPIPSLLMSTPIQSITGYPLYDRPMPDPLKDSLRKNDENSLVTLIGDSAHPMAAFKGKHTSSLLDLILQRKYLNFTLITAVVTQKAQGANQALIDAITLARVLRRTEEILSLPNDDDRIFSKDDTISLALAWFENEMMERVKPKVIASADASQYLHTKLAISQNNITRSDSFKRLSRDKH